VRSAAASTRTFISLDIVECARLSQRSSPWRRLTSTRSTELSELLNDSPTATKLRDRILADMSPSEKILFATEGQVVERLGGTDFILFIGAIVVTTERLAVFESKALGRMGKNDVAWRDVQKDGRTADGMVAIQKSGSRPIWEVSIWEGKSYKSPLNMRQLDLLSLSIDEARSAIAAERGAEAADAYEELKRKRGF
jgi:hypothetical protein